MDASISLYNTLFYVSMGVAALGLAMAVFFFFYFDIPAVYAMMTGKARKETVRRMEEQNARTGRLRMEHGHSGRTGRTGHTSRTGRTGRTGKFRSAEVVHPEALVPQVPEQRPDTGVLSVQTPETSVLAEETGATVMLNRNVPQDTTWAEETEVLHTPARNSFPFHMTETTLVIHTDEII